MQDCYSKSVKNVIRGLHYQLNPVAQAKIVSCIKGEIFDVAVDLRKNSPTYGKWTSVILSGKNKKSVYVPPQFAHGFCVLSEEAEILYKMGTEYSSEYQRGIIWNDKDININWPVANPIISDRDSIHKTFKDSDNNFY